jgi:deoxyinosine 3'endonuclease (endonuclease V)
VRVLELHPWRVSYREAVGIQNSLLERLRLEPLARPLRLVAGADVAYPRLSRRTYAAVVVLTLALLFDGQGLAHPRRFGLACHAGLLLGTPSALEHPQVLSPAAHGRLMRPGHRARTQAWALIRGL